MAAEIAGSIIAAASGLLGVAVGGYFTVLNQKRERRQQRISVQLAEFYSPMLGLRFDVLARSELRLKLNGTADATWRKMMHEAQEIGVEHLTRVNKERFPVFEKIIEDDNRQFAEVIMPAYRKMLELFTSKMHLAEFSTIQHFTALLEFVEIWNRWLDSSIPPEVVTNIGHTETKLYPFYEDLESNFVIMQRALTGKRRWWKRSHAPVLKVLPSQ